LQNISIKTHQKSGRDAGFYGLKIKIFLCSLANRVLSNIYLLIFSLVFVELLSTARLISHDGGQIVSAVVDGGKKKLLSWSSSASALKHTSS
jgi:hypothetical protein